jgi:prepilin signal peptidase PulO-like enzyme (type II secretory pathway)
VGPLTVAPWQAIAIVVDYLAILSLLVAISAYDVKHTIIPDAWVYALGGLALVSQLIVPQPAGFAMVSFLLAGPALALPFVVLWFVSGGRWMGLGDAKLALAVGWLLGPVYGFLSLMFAFVLGAIVSVCILLPLSSPAFWAFVGRFTPTSASSKSALGFTMKSEVAFGPFLAAACVVVWLMLLFGHDPLAYLGAGLP